MKEALLILKQVDIRVETGEIGTEGKVEDDLIRRRMLGSNSNTIQIKIEILTANGARPTAPVGRHVRSELDISLVNASSLCVGH